MFAEIVLTKNTKAIDMAFTYRVPEEFIGIIKIGHKVIVPFGIGSILSEGYVIKLVDKCDLKSIKSINQIIEDVLLSKNAIDLVHWMKEEYLCSFSEAISAIVPSGTKLNRKTTYEYLKHPVKKVLKVKQLELLNILKEHGSVNEDIVKEKKLYIHLKDLINSKYVKKHVVFSRDVNITFKRIVTCLINNDELLHSLGKLSKQAIKQRQVLKFICEVRTCDVALLNRELKANKSVLDKLVALSFIKIEQVEKSRKPDVLKEIQKELKNSLTYEQDEAYKAIEKSIEKNIYETFLIHGVTGSGKTEVYMQLAERVIKENKQVIILVPEISLTPQIVAKFIKRFGSVIAIMHSKVSQGERFDQYRSIQAGEVSIIIGARSAIFSPCSNLGLIIIDEEHENTYKSDSNPKYSTIEVAEYLARRSEIPLVLASATPSVNSYYKAEIGEYKLLEIKRRFNNFNMPKVSLIDMREELVSGNKSIFSELLIDKINEKLEKKEQIILFYNRKGYSTFVSCRMCGHALKCPRCDIALTYHHHSKTAKCSYCDFNIKVLKNCPECSSTYFKYFGAGTEKVEEMLTAHFPEANIARLDSETTSKKGSLESIIKNVELGKIDILLGTQMVTKGLDFKNVTLVGALSADMSLNLPDYRAPEKTFQLLTQVAGRAGRGEKPGEVVIQTYSPENYAVYNSIDHDYLSFYREEKQMRDLYGYPPYKELISILVVGSNEDNLIRSAHNLHREIERFIKKKVDPDHIDILGPNPAVFTKLNNKYRWQIIIKFDKIDLNIIRNILHFVCVKNKNKVVLNDVYISININPMSLL